MLIYSHKSFLWQWANRKACIRHVLLCICFQFPTVNFHGLFFPFCSFQTFIIFIVLSPIHTGKKKNCSESFSSSVFRLVLIILLWNSSSSTISLLSYVASNTHGHPEVLLLWSFLRTLQYFSCCFLSIILLDQHCPSLNFILCWPGLHSLHSLAIK